MLNMRRKFNGGTLIGVPVCDFLSLRVLEYLLKGYV